MLNPILVAPYWNLKEIEAALTGKAYDDISSSILEFKIYALVPTLNKDIDISSSILEFK